MTTIAAVAAMLATAACSAATKPHAAATPTSTPTSAPPTASPSPAPTATAAKTPTPILTDRRTIPIGFTVTLLVPAGPVVYAFGVRSGRVTIARVDVSAKSVTALRSVSGDAVRASVGGGRLAVLTSGDPNRTTDATIRLLDLRTLAPVASRTLTPAGDVLARPEATYVSTPGRIMALDPSTLRTERTISVDGSGDRSSPGALIAADPRSDILYAGIQDGSGAEPRVDIVDLRTGRTLARPRVAAVVGAMPQGYGDDAWIVFATGNFASAELLGPTGHVLASTENPIGPNSASIAVTGRHLWISPGGSAGFRMSCRDLRTGAIQASATPSTPSGLAAADDTHVYTTNGSDLIVFTPAGACA